jgi:hypothetical protein
MNFFGVKHLCPDFLVTSDHWNLGKAGDALPTIFFKK